MAEEESQPEEPTEKSRENPFFRLLIFATGIFVFTMLVLVASYGGDPNHPINRFLKKFASSLIAAEVVVIIVVGFLAMYLDRRTYKSIAKLQQKESPEELNQE